MAIVNGYATLAQFKSASKILNTDAADDALIEDLITRASRTIDGITGKWFYAYTDTRYFDLPADRCLIVDAPLLAITTLTNGDGTTIASTEYHLEPINQKPYSAVVLYPLSTTAWTYSTTTGTERCISISGSWGFVNRAATDPYSYRHIYNTEQACLQIARQVYLERAGTNTGGQVQITGAGVVITPYGAVPKSAMDLLRPYIPHV